MEKPNPQPMQEFDPFEELNVTEYKRVDCASYKKCLNSAIQNKWKQFHCNSCIAHKPQSTRASDLVQLSHKRVSRDADWSWSW